MLFSFALFWLPSLSFSPCFLTKKRLSQIIWGNKTQQPVVQVQEANRKSQRLGERKKLGILAEFIHIRNKEKSFVGVALESDQSDAGSIGSEYPAPSITGLERAKPLD